MNLSVIRRIKWAAFVVTLGCGVAVGSLDIQSGPKIIEPEQVRFLDRTGASISNDGVLIGVDGKSVGTKGLVQGKRTVLNFVYFGCPTLCGQVVGGLQSAVNEAKNWPEDAQILTISINPDDTPSKAATYQQAIRSKLKDPRMADRWRVFVGAGDQIRQLANEVGFQYKKTDNGLDFIHPAGVIVLDPEGAVVRYLLGLTFDPKDLELALSESQPRQGRSLKDQTLLFCYAYDPKSGSYVLQAVKVMKVAGGFVAILMIAGITWLFFSESRKVKE